MAGGIRMKVSITDKGSRKTVQQVFGSGNAAVKVGILGAKGEATAEGSNITVADLAAIHEFGLGVPERSFIRSFFDAQGAALGDLMIKLMKRAISAAVAGSPITDAVKRRILSQIGAVAAGGIQARMSAGEITPPLAESTIARKGSSTPLIDTGQLRSSVAYEVEMGVGDFGSSVSE